MMTTQAKQPRKTSAKPGEGLAPGTQLAAYLPALRQHARGLTNNRADSDDLVQECAVRALENIGQFRPGTNMLAWLKTILSNTFVDGLRRAARRRRFLERHSLSQGAAAFKPDQLTRLEFLAVDHALEALPAVQRHALIMVAVDRITYADAARKAGVPVGTIRSRVSRARQELAASSHGQIRPRRPPQQNAAVLD